jgi:DNA-binding protein HU-beta
MNKTQLIDALADETKLSKPDAKKVLEAFIKVTTDTLRSGEGVALVGFGSFGISQRSARIGRNPRSGKEIKITAKKVVKFKAGKGLTDKIQ